VPYAGVSQRPAEGITRFPAATPPTASALLPVPAQPIQRAVAAVSLAEGLSACTKLAEGRFQTSIEIPNGKGKLVFPAGYRGRRHLECVITALLDEATAIDRDYGEIVRSNYPDVRDAKAICQIEPARLEDHVARTKTFDVRVTALQKAFATNAVIVEEVRQSMGNIDLSSMNDSGALMTSILEYVGGPIDQLAARERDVLRLMQGIEASKRSMTTVQNVRKVICP
jgi:hypothetical protein